MALSLSKRAYEDCYEVLDRALEVEAGVRLDFETHGQAFHMRSRINYARTLDRKLSQEIYEPGQPDYGVSQYDTLAIRNPCKEGGKWCIYVKKRSIGDYTITELGAAE